MHYDPSDYFQVCNSSFICPNSTSEKNKTYIGCFKDNYDSRDLNDSIQAPSFMDCFNEIKSYYQYFSY